MDDYLTKNALMNWVVLNYDLSLSWLLYPLRGLDSALLEEKTAFMAPLVSMLRPSFLEGLPLRMEDYKKVREGCLGGGGRQTE